MSGSDETTVKVAQDNGYKTQWARGLFYRKEGGKYVVRSDRIKVGVVLLFVVTTIGLLFKDDPMAGQDQSESFTSPRSVTQSNPTLDLASYNAKKPSPKVKGKKAAKIAPLSIVSSANGLGIPLGTSVKAKLKTGGTNGPVKAVLLEDVEFGGDVIIPEGSVIWGTGSSTEERLIVSFSKFVGEDGVAVDIKATAYDSSDSVLGLKGSVLGRTSKKIAAGAGLGLAGALHTLQKSENIGGVPVKKPSLENAILSGAAGAALGIAEQELEDLKNRQNVVEVPKDSTFILVFGEM